MDLSKRANLKGVREVRGLVLPTFDPSFMPTQVVESEWAPMVRSDIESEDSEFWRFVGQASIVGKPYTVRDAFGEFQETIMPGAWDKTFSENPDVMFNYMHEPLTTMATTRGGGLKLAADPHLDVLALVPRSDITGQTYMPKVQRGDAESMSFAFRVGGQVWNDDFTDRKITEIIMHRGDVASIISGFGANPPAWGNVRSDLQQFAHMNDGGPAFPAARISGGTSDVPFMTPHDYVEGDDQLCVICGQEAGAAMHNMPQAANDAQDPDLEERDPFLDFGYATRERELALAAIRVEQVTAN